MADTLPNIELQPYTWVDIYAATGIAVGTSILIDSLGEYDVRLVEKATQPTDADGYVVLSANTNISKTFEDTPSGAWAYSRQQGLINVQVLV